MGVVERVEKKMREEERGDVLKTAETIRRYQECAERIWALFSSYPLRPEHPARTPLERLEAVLDLGLVLPTVVGANERVSHLLDALGHVSRSRGDALRNLASVQERCTELLIETRLTRSTLRALLSQIETCVADDVFRKLCVLAGEGDPEADGF